jgi:hypothetical protein
VTNDKGRFQLQLTPGNYKLITGGQGYSTVEVLSATVRIGAETDLTIPVQKSVIEETITYGTATPLMATATAFHDG